MLNNNANKTEYMIISSKKNNRGAAMVVAIIVVAVLMIFTFSLLLVSYTLYSSQNKKVASKKCSEAANTLSTAMGAELDEVQNPNAYINSDLWIYLRFHLMQDDWPFYEPALDGHKTDDAVKTFSMMVNPNYIPNGSSTLDGYPGEVKIKVYWMMPEWLYEENKDDESMDFLKDIDISNLSINKKSEIRLFLEITCESANQSYTVKNKYHLSIRKYDESISEEEAEKSKIEDTYGGNSTYSYNCTIKPTERWRWVYDGRMGE